MKTVTLYLSQTKLTPHHCPIVTDDGTTLYIRATVSNQTDQEALDSAQPMTGETVLNTKELTRDF
jgi:hypothetical protein